MALATGIGATMNDMSDIKSPRQWMDERGLSLGEVIAVSKLEPRVVDAMLHGRYTPSPEQRQSLAAALGVTVEQIAWGHATPVEAMYGHGPQFGRSP